MIKSATGIVLDPFTVLYVGFGKVVINKGFVIDATDGSMVSIEGLTDAWKGSPVPLSVSDGDTISLKLTHASRDEYKKYMHIRVDSAEIIVGDEENTDTTTIIKIATVQYDDDGHRIEQFLNSDVFVSIRGTLDPACD